MATALINAIELVDKVWTTVNVSNNGNMPQAEAIALVQAYAAIAQAEQLKRIADMMESDRQAAKVEQDARAYAAQVKYGR